MTIVITSPKSLQPILFINEIFNIFLPGMGDWSQHRMLGLRPPGQTGEKWRGLGELGEDLK